MTGIFEDQFTGCIDKRGGGVDVGVGVGVET
jgi:hypothetical protein